MMKSMTGYGRREAETRLGKLVIEVKSWNHRYCNITVRTSELLSRFEHQIQSTILKRSPRGQIQISVELLKDPSISSQIPQLDLGLAKQYHQQLVQLQRELDLRGDVPVSLLAQLPGVLTLEGEVLDEKEIWKTLHALLQSVLAEWDKTREAEGVPMLEDMAARLQSIQTLAEQVKTASADLVQATRAKLETRLTELFEGRVEVDPDRLVVEAGVIASRSDITEELVRLDSHCLQFAEYFQVAEPVGRQLDFLLQEMNREVNTISAKASLPVVSSTCVALKTEIEKIRQLVQNVE